MHCVSTHPRKMLTDSSSPQPNVSRNNGAKGMQEFGEGCVRVPGNGVAGLLHFRARGSGILGEGSETLQEMGWSDYTILGKGV